jgi:hypothetical protein
MIPTSLACSMPGGTSPGPSATPHGAARAGCCFLLPLVAACALPAGGAFDAGAPVAAPLLGGAFPAAACACLLVGALLLIAAWRLFCAGGGGASGLGQGCTAQTRAAGGRAPVTRKTLGVRRGLVAMLRLFMSFAVLWDGAQAQTYYNNATLVVGGVNGIADGVGTAAQLNRPYGFTMSNSGVLYFADYLNNMVRMVFPNLTVLTFAGGASGGSSSGVGYMGTTTTANIREPTGVALNSSSGTLFVSYGGGICSVLPNRSVYNIYYGSTANGLAFRQDAIFFVSSSFVGRVLANGTAELVAGTATRGYADGVGINALFDNPQDIVLFSGQLLVAEAGNAVLRFVDPSSRRVSLFAGTPTIRGTADGFQPLFSYPLRLSVRSADSLSVYVLDLVVAGFSFSHQLLRKVVLLGTVAFASTITPFPTVFSGSTISYGLWASPSSSYLLLANQNSIFNVSLLSSTICPSGYYCTSAVLPCSSGTYSGSGQYVCCSAGYIAPGGAQSCTACPAGTSDAFSLYASTPATACQPCSPGTYQNLPGQVNCASCPSSFYAAATGSTQCALCPAGTSTMFPGAASAANCVANNIVSGQSLSGGTSCSSNASCAIGKCLGGFCCNSAAVALGCIACQAGTGSCALYSPGEACSSAADCGTNLCLGGCCCAATAIQTLGCASCACWSNASTTAATAGACSSTTAAPTTNTTLQCNSTVSLSASVPLSRIIAFPASSNVTDATPLVLLPATSPLNTYGVDIIVATAAACAAFSANAAATTCSSFSYALSSGTYYYLGAASALGMTSTPSCSA